MWHRLHWARFIVYIGLVVLIYHLVSAFLTPVANVHPPRPSPADVAPSKHRDLHFDYPWYRKPHPRPPILNNYSTGALSAAERARLHKHAVDTARQKALAVFYEVEGIPGSQQRTAKQAAAFRARVDCWHKGAWVKGKQQVIRKHFQDPTFGVCAKKHKQDGTDYVWKPSSAECSLAPTVDTAAWCNVLRGRHVLVIGDLVQYQLHDLLLDVLRDGPTVCFGELNCKGN